MKKKFTPILGDLSQLSEQAQTEYVLGVCEHLQVPAELGLVVLAFMDTGDGSRQKIVYVKRGATDIIRDKKKINVTSLAPLNGDGYVGFTATGTDSTGRQEMAVGAVSIKGLSGQAVANAIKTAQTQSLRRMTLQFAGGGFLDETEVNEKTTNIATSSLPLSQIAQPTVPPNASAGKDITEPAVSPNETPKPELAEGTAEPSAHPVVQAEEPRRKRRKKMVTLDSVVEEAKRMDLAPVSLSETFQAELEPIKIPAEIFELKHPPVPPPAPKTEEADLRLEVRPVDLKPEVAACTKEQQDEFRRRFSIYVNDILPKGGFLQSEKFGTRHNKLKLFVEKMFPGVNTKNLSAEQWNKFLGYLDTKVQEIGAAKLVKVIDKEIGESNA